MRAIFLSAVTAIVAFAQPVVSNIRVDDTDSNGGHSSFRVTWDSDVHPDNQRVQWGPTAAYGRVIYAYSPYGGNLNQQMIVSGLQAGSDMDQTRTVHLCPQSHSSEGWSSCAERDQAVTIPAPPAFAHPVPPGLPVVTTIPDPPSTGCTIQTAKGDLSDIQEKIDVAVANQPSNCQVINILPGGTGANQGGGGHGIPYPNFPPPADADVIPTSTGLNTDSNRLTPSTKINSFVNGQRVRLGGGAFGILPTGLYEGVDYCIADSTGLAGSSFQLQLWPACNSTVSLNTAGYLDIYVIPYPPPHSNYIQIRCDASNLPPEGVRITPQWKSVSNSCPWTLNALGVGSGSVGALYFQGPAHHIFIGPGIDFTQTNSHQNDTTDPTPWPTWITTRASNDHIAIKQNWFTGLGVPERTWRGVAFEGSNFDFAENYMTGIDYWMPAKNGLAPTVMSPTVVLVSGGSFVTGASGPGISTCPSVAPFTMTLMGSTSGSAYVSLQIPTCQVFVTQSTPAIDCSGCTTLNGSGFPLNTAGNRSQGPIAACFYTAGKWAYCSNYDGVNAGFSVHNAEGPSQITSLGPGPMRFANNFYSAHGNGFHLDDTATFGANYSSVTPIPSNILFARNVFATPELYRNGSPANNGLVYSNRNAFECKRCRYTQLDGNEFYGNYADVNQGAPILINANAAGAGANTALNPVVSTAGDFTVTNNLIHDVGAAMQIGGGPPNANAVPQLGRRFLIRNNLIYNLNGAVYYAHLPGYKTSAWGQCFEFSFGAEDVITDHNTCYSLGGSISVGLMFISKMIEGFQFTNNDLHFRGSDVSIDWGSAGVTTPNCSSLSGATALNCISNGTYGFSNNLLNVGQISLRPTSGFNAPRRPVGGREAPAGHNQSTLEDALGWITNIVPVEVTATGAVITFHSPDSEAACYVAHGIGADPLSWSRSNADTSNSKERSISVSQLKGNGSYSYQVWCSGAPPSATQSLQTPSN